MTEQERINENLQRQIDAQNARIDNFLTKIDMLITEMRDRDNQRAAEIRSRDDQRAAEIRDRDNQRAEEIRTRDNQRAEEIRNRDNQYAEEIRNRDNQRAEDIREIRASFQSMQSILHDMQTSGRNLNIVTILGVAAIVIAVLLK